LDSTLTLCPAGNYNIGFIDPTEYRGPLSYVDVDPADGFWKFQASGFSIQDKPHRRPAGNGNGNGGGRPATGNNRPPSNSNSTTPIFVPVAHSAIADTGTTLLMLPAAVAQAYYLQVPDARTDPTVGGWVFPCTADLPDLTLHVGRYRAVIPGELIKFAPVDTDDFDTAKVCYGGVQSASGLPFAIYGDVFFKATFTVFDVEGRRLGFAPKA